MRRNKSDSSPNLSLLVPVAAWPAPPQHDVSAVCTTPIARAAIVTGSSTGQLCLWSVEDNYHRGASCAHDADAASQSPTSLLQLAPRALLLGHAAPIVLVAPCLFERSETICSLCRNGLLNVWDPMDGRCLSSAAATVLPNATAGVILPDLTHAAVGGEGSHIVIVQLSTMTVRCTLAPLDDWCLSLAAVSAGDQGTQLLCLDASSVLRSWHLSVQSSGHIEVFGASSWCTLPPPQASLQVEPTEVQASDEEVQRAALQAAMKRRAERRPRDRKQPAYKMTNPWSDDHVEKTQPICERSLPGLAEGALHGAGSGALPTRVLIRALPCHMPS